MGGTVFRLLLIISLTFHYIEKYITKSRNLTARCWKFSRKNGADTEYQIAQWVKDGNIGLSKTKKLRDIVSNQCWTYNLELDNQPRSVRR